MDRTALVALDIETDTSTAPHPDGRPAGLDPRVSAVRSVALHGDDGTVVIDDHLEARLLRTLAAWLDDPDTDARVIVTWNGSRFDLPYLADRARRVGVELPLELTPDPRRVRDPLPGHAGGYRARLGRHRHVDLMGAYRGWCRDHGVGFGLKAVARAHGLDPVVVDTGHLSDLTVVDRVAYNLSDVVVTHALAVRLGDDLDTHVDP